MGVRVDTEELDALKAELEGLLGAVATDMLAGVDRFRGRLSAALLAAYVEGKRAGYQQAIDDRAKLRVAEAKPKPPTPSFPPPRPRGRRTG